MHYNYIAIEGNIGVGKTTLCQMLAIDFDCRLVLEDFKDNPFLKLFYENQERYALSVELFFMAERLEQMQSAIFLSRKNKKPIIADYFFEKTHLFAKNNLKGDEYKLFKRLYQLNSELIPKPDLIIYLHRSPTELLKNIEKRGRGYEKSISEAYLNQIEKMYADAIEFEFEKKVPILFINLSDNYFENTDFIYQYIKSLLLEKHEIGLKDYSFEK